MIMLSLILFLIFMDAILSQHVSVNKVPGNYLVQFTYAGGLVPLHLETFERKERLFGGFVVGFVLSGECVLSTVCGVELSTALSLLL